ncbi:MAG: hypothetical protein U1E54_01525 [Candidatus Levybacteria bacterium]|nr:hypothetical protein [Candidatus Levybacteria bacterium]
MASSKKDSITLSRNGFITILLFVVAVTLLVAYAYLNYSGVK